MEEFKAKTITEALHPPMFWERYVDDTGVVIRKVYEDALSNISTSNTIASSSQLSKKGKTTAS